MIDIPAAVAAGQAEKVSSLIITANYQLAMTAEDTLNEKYLFKRVKLEPGNYQLLVVHRADRGGIISAEIVQFVVK
jgi:hypothetical protein